MQLLSLFFLATVPLSSTLSTSPRPTGCTLKIALDAYGNIASLSPNSTVGRFTNAKSLDLVHRLRLDSDAVLVGANTVIADNPSLIVRRGYEKLVTTKQPTRVILDPNLRTLAIPDAASLAIYQCNDDNGLNTIVYHTKKDDELTARFTRNRVKFKLLERSTTTSKCISPKTILEDLRINESINHLMVEGGGVTACQFLSAGCIDRAIIIRANGFAFKAPTVPSNINEDILSRAGLTRINNNASSYNDNVIEFWSKVEWPTSRIADDFWP